MRRVPSSIVVALAVMMLVGSQVASAHHRPAPPPNVDVQLLAFNDFHGQLEALPPASTSGRPESAG